MTITPISTATGMPGGRFVLYTAAALSAGMYAACFPPLSWQWIAWIALCPILCAVQAARSRGEAMLLGWLFGLAHNLLVFHWLGALPSFRWHHAAILGAYLGLYPALWAVLAARLRTGSVHFPFTVAALWVVLEWLRDHAGFLALPWVSFAAAQTGNLPLLQNAAWGGSALVSFAVVFGNAMVYRLVITRSRQLLWMPAAVLLVFHGIGFWRLAAQESGHAMSVAVVQPAFAPGARRTQADAVAALATLTTLSTPLLDRKIQLVVWPESAMPDPVSQPSAHRAAQALLKGHRTELLSGAAETVKFANTTGMPAAASYREYNSAYLFSNEGSELQRYRKRRLLPFGEYRPLEDTVSWPDWLAPAVFTTTPGEISPPIMSADGTRVGVLICWETLFAGDALDAARQGARVLAAITNDAWFHSEAASRQHNLSGILRAVETGLPVLLASNTGPSQVIDRSGRILTETPYGHAHAATATMSLPTETSLYVRYGDIFVVLAALWCIGGVFWSFRLRAVRASMHRGS